MVGHPDLCGCPSLRTGHSVHTAVCVGLRQFTMFRKIQQQFQDAGVWTRPWGTLIHMSVPSDFAGNYGGDNLHAEEWAQAQKSFLHCIWTWWRGLCHSFSWKAEPCFIDWQLSFCSLSLSVLVHVFPRLPTQALLVFPSKGLTRNVRAKPCATLNTLFHYSKAPFGWPPLLFFLTSSLLSLGFFVSLWTVTIVWKCSAWIEDFRRGRCPSDKQNAGAERDSTGVHSRWRIRHCWRRLPGGGQTSGNVRTCFISLRFFFLSKSKLKVTGIHEGSKLINDFPKRCHFGTPAGWGSHHNWWHFTSACCSKFHLWRSVAHEPHCDWNYLLWAITSTIDCALSYLGRMVKVKKLIFGCMISVAQMDGRGCDVSDTANQFMDFVLCTWFFLKLELVVIDPEPNFSSLALAISPDRMLKFLKVWSQMDSPLWWCISAQITGKVFSELVRFFTCFNRLAMCISWMWLFPFSFQKHGLRLLLSVLVRLKRVRWPCGWASV